MSAKSPKKKKDYEIPCQLLPETTFDMSGAIPPSQRLNSPAANLVRDELLHEPIDFAQGNNAKQRKKSEKGKKDRNKAH
jgi:hypothetical protein